MIPTRALGAALLACAAALALLVTPDSAVASGKKHCPPGLAKKGYCTHSGHRGQVIVVEPRTVVIEPAPVIVRPRIFVVGDYVPRTVVYQRVYYEEYRLPRPQPGYFYANVGGKIYLLAEATQRVIEAINLVDAATR